MEGLMYELVIERTSHYFLQQSGYETSFYFFFFGNCFLENAYLFFELFLYRIYIQDLIFIFHFTSTTKKKLTFHLAYFLHPLLAPILVVKPSNLVNKTNQSSQLNSNQDEADVLGTLFSHVSLDRGTLGNQQIKRFLLLHES